MLQSNYIFMPILFALIDNIKTAESILNLKYQQTRIFAKKKERGCLKNANRFRWIVSFRFCQMINKNSTIQWAIFVPLHHQWPLCIKDKIETIWIRFAFRYTFQLLRYASFVRVFVHKFGTCSQYINSGNDKWANNFKEPIMEICSETTKGKYRISV